MVVGVDVRGEERGGGGVRGQLMNLEHVKGSDIMRIV